jgi:hypothetical protein
MPFFPCSVFPPILLWIYLSRNVLVMSLWKVSDRHTQELMGEFYRHLLAGRPRTDALREAQFTLKAKYPHPYYWGAFISQGDPRPLSSQMFNE